MTETHEPYRAGPADVALLIAEFRAALPMSIADLADWGPRFERAGVEVTLCPVTGGGSRPGRDGLELRYQETEGEQGR